MSMNRGARCVLALAALMMVGACGTTQTGQCEAPQETLEWWFIVDRGPTGSQTKCVYCDPTVTVSEVPDWIRSHAGEEYRDADDDQLSGALSCLYVYGPGQTDTEDTCRVAACGGAPTVNDPVDSAHQAGRAIARVRRGD